MEQSRDAHWRRRSGMEWRRGELTSRDGFLLKCGSIDDPAINEYVVRNFGQQSWLAALRSSCRLEQRGRYEDDGRRGELLAFQGSDYLHRGGLSAEPDTTGKGAGGAEGQGPRHDPREEVDMGGGGGVYGWGGGGLPVPRG